MTNARTTTNRNFYKRAVGVFKSRQDTESVLQALKKDGYDMNRISLIARHSEDVQGADEINHGNEAKEGAGIGATTGTVLGGIGGFLVGAGVLAIPGVGPVLAAGVGISELAATLAGAGIGAAAGGIIGALVGAGIPEDRAKVYDKRVKSGDHLLLVSGTEDDLRRVESIMRSHHVEEFGIYDAPDLMRDEPMVAQPTVRREDTAATTTNATETRDINNDGEPEVLIVDKRSEATRKNDVRR